MHLPKYSWIVRLKFSPLLTSFICTLRWHWPCSLRQNARRPAVNWISSKSLVTLVWSHCSHLPVPNSWNVSSCSSGTEGLCRHWWGIWDPCWGRLQRVKTALAAVVKRHKVTYCELVGNYTKSNCGLTVFFSLMDLLVHKNVLLNDIFVNITLY